MTLSFNNCIKMKVPKVLNPRCNSKTCMNVDMSYLRINIQRQYTTLTAQTPAFTSSPGPTFEVCYHFPLTACKLIFQSDSTYACSNI